MHKHQPNIAKQIAFLIEKLKRNSEKQPWPMFSLTSFDGSIYED